jgi:DNA-directed RNA polymerase subunit RPC12/RpoP
MIDGHGVKLMINDIDIREDYSIEQCIERELILSSRGELVEKYKLWASALWGSVILRAINDAALVKYNKKYKKLSKKEKIELSIKMTKNSKDSIGKSSEELKKKNEENYRKILAKEREMDEIEYSALNFLFNDEHRIPWDDFIVEIKCPKEKCKNTWKRMMSEAAATESICPHCGYRISTKYIDYRIQNEIIPRTINFKDILLLLGYDNFEEWRKQIKEVINYKVEHPEEIK